MDYHRSNGFHVHCYLKSWQNDNCVNFLLIFSTLIHSSGWLNIPYCLLNMHDSQTCALLSLQIRRTTNACELWMHNEYRAMSAEKSYFHIVRAHNESDKQGNCLAFLRWRSVIIVCALSGWTKQNRWRLSSAHLVVWSSRFDGASAYGVLVRAATARRRYDTFIGNTDRGVAPVDQDGINGLLQGKQVSALLVFTLFKLFYHRRRVDINSHVFSSPGCWHIFHWNCNIFVRICYAVGIHIPSVEPITR